MRLPTPLVLAALLLCAGCVTFDDDSRPLHSDVAPPVQVAAIAPIALSRLEPGIAGDRYVTDDGTVLPLRSWLPDGPPTAVILALHGFNDYSNAFALPAPDLAAHGIAVYAYDQRGFGGAPRPGHWAGAGIMAADAARAAVLLHRRYPNVPLYLLGESMGGAVAILAATRPVPVDGVILSAPAVWGRQTMNIFERAGLWLAGLLPSMQVSRSTLPIEVMASDNIPMLRALGADPLVLKETRTDTLNGLVDLMTEALAAARHLTKPTLVLYGEHDEIVPRGPIERFVANLPVPAHQRVALYPHGYHMLLRDLEAPIVLGDLESWLRNPHAPLPSGADHGARTELADKGAGVVAD